MKLDGFLVNVEIENFGAWGETGAIWAIIILGSLIFGDSDEYILFKCAQNLVCG